MWASRGLGLAVGAAVIPLAVFHGGYAPTAWGWGSIACFWVALLALFARRALILDRLVALWCAALLALTAWTAISATWSQSTPRTLLEVERDLLYLAAIAALALIARRGSEEQLVTGVAVGAAAVVIGALGYYLIARPAIDITQGYLLFRPIGYANAFGGLIAITVPLLLGLSIAGVRREARAAFAAAAVVLLVALYLTQNRSGWLALATAVIVWILTTSARSDAAVALVLAALPAAIAVAIVARLDLLRTDRAAGRAEDAHLALGVVALCAAIGAAGTVFAPRFALGHRFVVRAVRAAALVVAAALVWAAAHAGDRTHYWHAAARGIEHRWLLGSGAGTFDEIWLRYRDIDSIVRDAHDLYLETFTELGIAGIALIAVALSLPLVARNDARTPVLAAARGAYCAFLVHAAFEWDWEMPIVTLPALVLGMALLLSSGNASQLRIGLSARVAGAITAGLLTLFAIDALAGNAYLVTAERRAQAGDDAAAQARAVQARRLLPWASEPWLVIADTRARAGDVTGARDALRTAVSRDRSDWFLWYRLAAASSGAERAAAVRQAVLLNPRLLRRR